MRFFVAISLLFVASSTHATDVKADLQVKYDALSTAFAHRDIDAFESMLASDYVLHVGPRKQGRTAVIADFKKQMGNMQNVKWVRKVTDAKNSGATVVVTVKSVFDGDFGQPGKLSHFWNKAVSQDWWTNSDGKGWMLKESTLVSLDAKVDGKPAGHFPSPSGKAMR